MNLKPRLKNSSKAYNGPTNLDRSILQIGEGPKWPEQKNQYSPDCKLKVVLEILKGEKTAPQLAGEVGVHPMVLSDWKKQFLENGGLIFTKSRNTKRSKEEREQSELFEQIDRLKMENERLKKPKAKNRIFQKNYLLKIQEFHLLELIRTFHQS